MLSLLGAPGELAAHRGVDGGGQRLDGGQQALDCCPVPRLKLFGHSVCVATLLGGERVTGSPQLQSEVLEPVERAVT
jgi:hypothetical protein